MTYNLDAALDDLLKPRPGWHGNFTTREAPEAMHNGTRVVKAASEPHDAHPEGSLGTVLGSIMHPDLGIAYFVEWDAKPKWAVLVVAWKLRGVS